MKLIGSDTSPYVRKARLVLLEKNIPHTYVVDPPSDPNSRVPLLNPLGRIPTLILDDGICVFDSTVITEYADTLNDTPILIPRLDVQARLRVRRMESLADGIMDSAIVVRMELIRILEKQDQSIIDMHNLSVTRALSYFSDILGQLEWCEGSHITLADLALFSALVYLDLRQPERDWRSAHQNLDALFYRLRTRPSLQPALGG